MGKLLWKMVRSERSQEDQKTHAKIDDWSQVLRRCGTRLRQPTDSPRERDDHRAKLREKFGVWVSHLALGLKEYRQCGAGAGARRPPSWTQKQSVGVSLLQKEEAGQTNCPAGISSSGENPPKYPEHDIRRLET